MDVTNYDVLSAHCQLENIWELNGCCQYCAIHWIHNPPFLVPLVIKSIWPVPGWVWYWVYKLHCGENVHPWAGAGCDVMQWHVPWQHDVWGQVQARERPSCWYLCWLLLCWINSTPRSPGSRLETPLTIFLGNVNKLYGNSTFSWF